MENSEEKLHTDIGALNGLIWSGKGQGSQSSSGTPSTQNFTKYPPPPTSGTMPSLQGACYVAACPTEQFTTMNLELFVQEGSLYHLYVVRIMTSKLKKKCSKESYVSDFLFIGMSVVCNASQKTVNEHSM